MPGIPSGNNIPGPGGNVLSGGNVLAGDSNAPSSSAGIAWTRAPDIFYWADNINGLNNAGLSDTNPISTWKNLGALGSAWDAVQTGSFRPTFGAVATPGLMNNKPCVRFNGAQWIVSPIVSLQAQPATWIVVGRQGDSNTRVWLGGSAANRNQIFIVGNNNIYLYAGGSGSALMTIVPGSFHSLGGWFSGASSIANKDGTSSGALAITGTQAFEQIPIGAADNGTNATFGDILLVAGWIGANQPTFAQNNASVSAYYGPTPQATVRPPGSPALWYDGQDIDGLNNTTLIDGQGISTWVNKGSLGNAGNAVQGTTGLRPFYRRIAETGKLGNKSAVDNGGTRWMSNTAFAAITQPLTVAVVAKTNATGFSQTIFDGALGGNVSLLAPTQVQPYSGVAYSTGQSFVVGTWETNLTTFNGASSTNRMNGVQVGPGNIGTTSVTNVGLFGLAVSGSTLMNGSIAEVLIYNDGTTAAAIETYLTARYGATPQASTIPVFPDLWYDATDVNYLNNVGIANNATIGTWKNKGSRSAAYDATQATGSAKPRFTASAFGGLPGVTFDGIDDYLGLGANETCSAASMFLVVSGLGANPGTKEPTNCSNVSFLMTARNWGVYLNGASLSGVTLATGAAGYVLGAVNPSSGLSVDLTTNGALVANGGAGFPSRTSSTIGSGSGGGNATDGVIHEYILIERAITSTERRAMEAYLGAKWGIAVV